MLEAGCAGKLLLSTNVGYAGKHKHAIILPTEEDKFVAKGVEILNYYRSNIEEMREKCLESRRYSLANFGWDKNVGSWLNALNF